MNTACNQARFPLTWSQWLSFWTAAVPACTCCSWTACSSLHGFLTLPLMHSLAFLPSSGLDLISKILSSLLGISGASCPFTVGLCNTPPPPPPPAPPLPPPCCCCHNPHKKTSFLHDNRWPFTYIQYTPLSALAEL